MVQESIYKRIAVIGCGAAGGFASVLLAKNPYNTVVAFDVKEPFSTLLPTGGGRCNLTYEEADVSEFVKNYPRGEKFLLSVFSRFGQEKTRSLFKDLGIKTYVQEDKRVFPVSNSSRNVVQTLQKHLETSNFTLKKESVIKISKIGCCFEILTTENKYEFDKVIIASGGRGNGFELAEMLGHNVIEPKPSLCALEVQETFLYKLSGLTFKDVEISSKLGKTKFKSVVGDILLSHKSITGPAIFKVSALNAFFDFDEQQPLELTVNLINKTVDEIESIIHLNQKKTIKNVFSMLAPESYICEILRVNNIEADKQVAQIRKNEKEILINSLLSLKLHAVKRLKNSEIVTVGGVNLKEIDSKTMQSKLVEGLYFVGEVLNIDAYTGGFNLQNCWSTAYIAASDLN